MRIIVHNFLSRDGLDPEEVAYGEGWHAARRGEPKSNNWMQDPTLKAKWDKGYDDGRNHTKMRANYYKGEIRKHGLKYLAPDAEDEVSTEQGYVARIVDPRTGRLVTKSDAFIRKPKADQWLSEKLEAAVRAGYRLSGSVVHTTGQLHDSSRARDVKPLAQAEQDFSNAEHKRDAMQEAVRAAIRSGASSTEVSSRFGARQRVIEAEFKAAAKALAESRDVYGWTGGKDNVDPTVVNGRF